jgi:hypothetical protein
MEHVFFEEMQNTFVSTFCGEQDRTSMDNGHFM